MKKLPVIFVCLTLCSIFVSFRSSFLKSNLTDGPFAINCNDLNDLCSTCKRTYFNARFLMRFLDQFECSSSFSYLRENSNISGNTIKPSRQSVKISTSGIKLMLLKINFLITGFVDGFFYFLVKFWFIIILTTILFFKRKKRKKSNKDKCSVFGFEIFMLFILIDQCFIFF